MNYYLYMLENAKKRHYVGITTDTNRRLKEHNSGGAKATRPFGPWKLIYSEMFGSRKEACQREWYLKHPKGYKEKRRIIEEFGKI